MKRVIRILLASLLMTVASLAFAVSPANAVITCGGKLGQPHIHNIGPASRITLRKGTSINYIYENAPEYYCPTGIYVHAGKDIFLRAFFSTTSVSITIKAYGWQTFPEWAKSAPEIDITEYSS